MVRAVELAHFMIGQSVEPGDWVVDATVGNGFDTLFLAQLVGAGGRVFGFDVQEAALEAAGGRVHGLAQVTLFHGGHEHLLKRLPEIARGRLAAVMFNLGYLPGGDKDNVTRGETTVAGLEQALSCIKTGGVVTLVLYRGHPGGEEEAAQVRSYVEGLPSAFTASQYARVNASRPAPELVVIERVG